MYVKSLSELLLIFITAGRFRLRRYWFVFSVRFGKRLSKLTEITNPFLSLVERGVLLPDEDSNLDKQNQNLSYYLYTIGQ